MLRFFDMKTSTITSAQYDNFANLCWLSKWWFYSCNTASSKAQPHWTWTCSLYTDTAMLKWLHIQPSWTGNSVHYCDVIIGAVASQITGASIICSTVCSGADQSEHQSSSSLAFARGINRWPVVSRHKGAVTWKAFQVMTSSWILQSSNPLKYIILFTLCWWDVLWFLFWH